ncbi:MAG: hypothetical protein A2Z72_04710 [Omnitrophica bacterium RBG_13_46_9]|nr:MAG: hypothetical protein A2Z72_04710 [Omnitrophica bacterium RBG_13_46_9]
MDAHSLPKRIIVLLLVFLITGSFILLLSDKQSRVFRHIKTFYKNAAQKKARALTLRYLSSGKSVWLKKVLDKNRGKIDRNSALIEFAEFIVNDKPPDSPFGRSRLKFLMANRDDFMKCLEKGIRTPSLFAQLKKGGWRRSDLYASGMLRLISSVPKSDSEYQSIINSLHLNNRDVIAVIGFGDSQLALAMANGVGREGKVIDFETLPTLVDFLNFMSEDLKLPQLEGRFCVRADIAIPPDYLDAALIRFASEDTGDYVRPWLDSIFKAMKPGGRAVILQPYSYKKVKRNTEFTKNTFLSEKLSALYKIPRAWWHPDITKKLCQDAGFEIHLFKEKSGLPRIYLLEVRKPGNNILDPEK